MKIFIIIITLAIANSVYADQASDLLISKKIDRINFSANEFVGDADWWSVDSKNGNVSIFTSTDIPNEYWAYRRNKLKFININSISNESTIFWELTPKDLKSDMSDFLDGKFLEIGNYFIVRTSSEAYILNLIRKEFYRLPVYPDNLQNIVLSKDGEMVLFSKRLRVESKISLLVYEIKTKKLNEVSSINQTGSDLNSNFVKFGFTENGESKIYSLIQKGNDIKSKVDFFFRKNLSLDKEIFIGNGDDIEYSFLSYNIHLNENKSILSMVVCQKNSNRCDLKLIKIDLSRELKTEIPLPNNDNIEWDDIKIVSKSLNAEDLIVNFGNRYLLFSESLRTLPIRDLYSTYAYSGFIVNLTNTSLPRGYPYYQIYDHSGNYLRNHPCWGVSYDYNWLETKSDGVLCLSNPEYNKSRTLYSINGTGEVTSAYSIPSEFKPDNIKSFQLKEFSNQILLRLFSNELRISYFKKESL